MNNTTRDLKYFFSGLDDPKIEKIQNSFEKKIDDFAKKYEDIEKYSSDPKKIAQALNDFENLSKNENDFGAVDYYLFLAQSLDSSDAKIQAKINLAQNFFTTQINKIIFFEHKLKHFSPKDKQNLLNASEILPFKHYLEKLFELEKHSLTQDQEILLNMIAKPASSNWENMVEKFLSSKTLNLKVDGKSLGKKTLTNLMGLLQSNDEKTRSAAAKGVDKINKFFAPVATEELNSLLEFKYQLDKLEKFSRPDASRHLADDIDSSVVDAMLEAVEKSNFLSHKYYELKSKILSKENLKYFERNIPISEVEKKYTWDETYKLVSEVFESLDPKFGEILKNLTNSARVDVFPKLGKRGGAFCISGPLKLPTYVMLNHSDRLGDVLTFAHEMGHAVNSELIKEKQNALNDSTPLSTAEVASTFFEDFVLQKLLEKCSDEEKLGLLMHRLNDDISTIFRQVACYRFEQDLHKNFRKKGYLDTKNINSLFKKHMKNYIGEKVEFEKNNGFWWVYWSHIRNYFYVYSYASGLLISKAMQNNVKKDKKYISQVKNFLSAGSSKSPKEIFLDLGIDISSGDFWLSGLKEIENTLSQTENLAKKLGKI